MSTAFRIGIPARYAATRLPGKPLRPLAGRPLIAHTVERAVEAGADEVVVATDDARIAEVAEAAGVACCMTAAGHRSGTDRLAECAEHRGWADADIVVNLQGDEPLMPARHLKAVAETLASDPQAAIATLCAPLTDAALVHRPDIVKVVTDASGYALYFSRAPIPWDRERFGTGATTLGEDIPYLRHIGVYAYRVAALKRIAQAQPCALEKVESLEQLRALYHGEWIRCLTVERAPPHGVDTEADLQRVERELAAGPQPR